VQFGRFSFFGRVKDGKTCGLCARVDDVSRGVVDSPTRDFGARSARAIFRAGIGASVGWRGTMTITPTAGCDGASAASIAGGPGVLTKRFFCSDSPPGRTANKGTCGTDPGSVRSEGRWGSHPRRIDDPRRVQRVADESSRCVRPCPGAAGAACGGSLHPGETRGDGDFALGRLRAVRAPPGPQPEGAGNGIPGQGRGRSSRRRGRS